MLDKLVDGVCLVLVNKLLHSFAKTSLRQQLQLGLLKLKKNQKSILGTYDVSTGAQTRKYTNIASVRQNLANDILETSSAQVFVLGWYIDALH